MDEAVGLAKTIAAIPDGAYDRMVWACRVNTLFFLMDDFLELEVRVLPKPKKKSNGELGEAHGNSSASKSHTRRRGG